MLAPAAAPGPRPRRPARALDRDAARKCRKRSFATDRRGRRPATAAMYRIPCLILGLADVERVGQCRAPNAPCRLHRQGLISRTPHTLDCHRYHLPAPQWIREAKQAAHWTRFFGRSRNRPMSVIQLFGLLTISSVFLASSAANDISAMNSPRIAATLLLARLNVPVRAGTESMLA